MEPVGVISVHIECSLRLFTGSRMMLAVPFQAAGVVGPACQGKRSTLVGIARGLSTSFLRTRYLEFSAPMVMDYKLAAFVAPGPSFGRRRGCGFQYACLR